MVCGHKLFLHSIFILSKDFAKVVFVVGQMYLLQTSAAFKCKWALMFFLIGDSKMKVKNPVMQMLTFTSLLFFSKAEHPLSGLMAQALHPILVNAS